MQYEDDLKEISSVIKKSMVNLQNRVNTLISEEKDPKTKAFFKDMYKKSLNGEYKSQDEVLNAIKAFVDAKKG